MNKYVCVDIHIHILTLFILSTPPLSLLHAKKQVSVIKVHPQHYGPEDLMDIDGNRTSLGMFI